MNLINLESDIKVRTERSETKQVTARDFLPLQILRPNRTYWMGPPVSMNSQTEWGGAGEASVEILSPPALYSCLHLPPPKNKN